MRNKCLQGNYGRVPDNIRMLALRQAERRRTGETPEVRCISVRTHPSWFAGMHLWEHCISLHPGSHVMCIATSRASQRMVSRRRRQPTYLTGPRSSDLPADHQGTGRANQCGPFEVLHTFSLYCTGVAAFGPRVAMNRRLHREKCFVGKDVDPTRPSSELFTSILE